jgi:hypothetical protein
MHPAVVEYRKKLEDKLGPGTCDNRTQEGLAALQKVLGVDHAAVKDYEAAMVADIESARKAREDAQTPQERIAGKIKYRAILEGRKLKADARKARAEAAYAAAKKELDEVEARVAFVEKSIADLDEEVKSLMLTETGGKKGGDESMGIEEGARVQDVEEVVEKCDEDMLVKALLGKYRAKADQGEEGTKASLELLGKLAELAESQKLADAKKAADEESARVRAVQEAAVLAEKAAAAAAASQGSGYGPADKSKQALARSSPIGTGK